MIYNTSAAGIYTDAAFNNNPGTSQRGGILTVEITIADGGESINLLHQIHVMNLP